MIKGGTVIDPANGVLEKKDVAVSEGMIEDVGRGISSGSSRRVIDAGGMIVTPGLVDLHAHVAHKVLGLCVDPYKSCLLNGTTTVVDAGSSGELNFTPFREFVINQQKVEVLAFLNIESLGMIEYANVQPGNTDQEWPKLLTYRNEIFAPLFVNLRKTTETIRKNPRTIVGIKWAHHGLRTLGLARRAADENRCMIMAESHFMPDLFKYLKRGDIATDIFHFVDYGPGRGHDGITEDMKNIREEVFAASRRGIVLDIGHGKGSFSWGVARLALREGLPPDTISTDLWSGNVLGPVFDLPTTMAKFLHLGMALEEIIRATTWKPALTLNRGEDIGSLRPGSRADIAVFKLRNQKTSLVDSYGKKEMGESGVIPVGVVKGGEVVRANV